MWCLIMVIWSPCVIIKHHILKHHIPELRNSDDGDDIDSNNDDDMAVPAGTWPCILMELRTVAESLSEADSV